MANHQLLDNVTHKNLRVITDRSAWYGDDIAATLVFPLEFRRLQSEYPIAFQKNAETGQLEPIALFGLVIHVDMDSPRISETEGVSVFLEHGGQSPYLEHISSVLNAIHQGYDQNRRLSQALQEYELVEPFSFDFELEDGSRKKLSGLYTLNEEKLASLKGAALEALHTSGFLENIYMVMASIANLRTLIDRKNQRL
jgi:hypothetical protein